MLADFKKFLMRGNLIDLAVAVIIGIAFGAVVTSLTKDVVLPFIAAIGGKASFDDVTFSVGDGVIRIGAFITVLINFVIVAAVCFLIVKVVEGLQALRRSGAADAPAPPEDIALLTEIRDLLAKR